MPKPPHRALFPLAFRVGVTGPRAIDPAAEPGIRKAVAQALAAVRDGIERLAGEPWASRVHAADADGRVRPILRLLSPLAEGADRLVAEEALKLGYVLDVALPFPQAEYERDFPDSVAGFRALLAQAGDRVLALDGSRGPAEWRSYEAVGHVVVRNCDLVVAVWDDSATPKGRGGTEDTIRFAAHSGPPVWWIRAGADAAPTFISPQVNLRDRTTAPHGEAAWSELRAYLEAAVRTPPGLQSKDRGIFNRIAEHLPRAFGSSGDPLLDFLNEPELRRQRRWTVHGRFMALAARGAKLEPVGAVPSPPEDYWSGLYAPADRYSLIYADRYRSSYVYAITFAALALSCAATALAFDAWRIHWLEPYLTVVEAGCVVLIFAIVMWNLLNRWHERWIGYRLLAELCRKQQALTLLGWSLPSIEITRAAGTAVKRNAWINWYFDAAMRASPLTTGWLGGAQLRQARDTIKLSLVAGQKLYHRNRRASSEEAAHILGSAGEACFLLTAVCIFLKLFLHAEFAVALSWLVAVMAALSAALFGIRAYAELEVLADQSERMEAILDAMEERLDGLDVEQPLASQDLGVDLFHLVTDMLADVAGWAQLFRMKVVGAG